MNVLIDINHPAHIHLYRNLILDFKEKGHVVLVTVKDESGIKFLLEKYRIPFINLGTKTDSILGKAINQVKYNYIVQNIVRRTNIDVGIGSSITIPHVSKITRMKSVVFDDDDDKVQPFVTYGSHPFCDYIVSPDAIIGKRKNKKTFYYSGYHELAYLHPQRFKPDPEVLKEAGLKAKEAFFIMRFNAFKAHHDMGISGLSVENKRCLIAKLVEKGKVFITMERELEPEFEKYRLKIPPEKVHSLIYYATMLIGDSQTMTSESAVLGTPALKCNSFAKKLSVPNELENKYKLCFSFLPTEFDKLIDKMDELLSEPYLKQVWLERRANMLRDKIDVSAFMIWFVENLPESARVIKGNPEYQLRFR